MYTFTFPIAGVSAWLSTLFKDIEAPFPVIYEAPSPSTTNTLAKLEGMTIALEGGYEVRLLNLNYLPQIKELGLQVWLAIGSTMYTGYYIDGKRVLEFRREVDGIDVAVAYAVDNKSAPITVRVAEAPAAA